MRIYYDLEGRHLYLNCGGEEYFSIRFPKEGSFIYLNIMRMDGGLFKLTFEEVGDLLNFWGSGINCLIDISFHNECQVEILRAVSIEGFSFIDSDTADIRLTFYANLNNDYTLNDLITINQASDEYFLAIYDYYSIAAYYEIEKFFDEHITYLPQESQMWAWQSEAAYCKFLGWDRCECPSRFKKGAVYERLKRLGKID
jgi:hypothetical protein